MDLRLEVVVRVYRAEALVQVVRGMFESFRNLGSEGVVGMAVIAVCVSICTSMRSSSAVGSCERDTSVHRLTCIVPICDRHPRVWPGVSS